MEEQRLSEKMANSSIYTSHKQVKAIPLNRGDYNAYQGWSLPKNENPLDEGYLVEYLDGGKSNHPDHVGYISWTPKEQFDNGYSFGQEPKEKTLHNNDISSTKVNVLDVKVVGNVDMFQLLCKTSSKKEGWMKSTKAMETPNGCLVQVTTQQKNPDESYSVAEALAFIPQTMVVEDKDSGRKLVFKK